MGSVKALIGEGLPMEDSVDRITAQWGQVRPELDVSAMALIGRIARLARGFDRDLQRVFSEHGLQAGEFDILATLMRADPDGAGLTAGALSESAMVTSGAITNRLDRLVSKALVTRETDPQNRRTVRVALTRSGRRVIEAALVDHVANEDALLAQVPEAERRQLEELLRVLLVAREGG